MSHKCLLLFFPGNSYSSSPAKLSSYFGSDPRNGRILQCSKDTKSGFSQWCFWPNLEYCYQYLYFPLCPHVAGDSLYKTWVESTLRLSIMQWLDKKNKSKHKSELFYLLRLMECAKSFRWSGHPTRTASRSTMWQFLSCFQTKDF